MAVAFAIAIVALGASVVAAPREIVATVTGVTSGDTLAIVDEAGARYEVRLADIAAPQGAEYYAPAARALLAGMIEGKRVRVVVTGERAPDSLYARVHFDKLDVNRELVRRGAAWMCWEYATDTSYVPDQSEAKRRLRGVWPRTWDIETLVDCRERPPAAVGVRR